MKQRIEALYEGGILRPLEELHDVEDNSRVSLVVESEPGRQVISDHPLSDCFGILPDEDAAEMSAAIEEEFEKVDEQAWK